MNKTLIALVAAGTLAVSMAGSTMDASAQGRGFGVGLATGLVGGAILGTAIASARPAYVVEPAPVVVVPRTCLVEQPVWSPRMGAYVMRPRRVAC
ncbi:MAG: hypothetical protein ACJ8F3_17520 [Xanthobacteraceae bacterium]